MLTIVVPGVELFDESVQEFTTSEDTVLHLEHSLVSLSKWESITEKAFLGPDPKSDQDVILYIKCMTLPEEADPEVYQRITVENSNAINDYITKKMTATWFSEEKKPTGRAEIITAELIYYWMIALGIPLECETWHLNRLFTLIKVCSLKSEPGKKMSRRDAGARQRELNAQRRAQLGTRG